MRCWSLPDRFRRLDHSLLRFVVVGVFGEILYLLLFALAIRAGLNSLVALAIAGGICLVLNAVLHASISFRVRFRMSLLFEYLLIQLFCLLLSLAFGWMLQWLKTPSLGIGVTTLLLWSGTSFLLTRQRFQRRDVPFGRRG